MKYYQMFERINFKVVPHLKEKICVWFEFNGELTDDNTEKFHNKKWEAMWEQCPKSWKGIFTGSQKQNIKLGTKHHPELSWSSVMEIREEQGSFDTPIHVRCLDQGMCTKQKRKSDNAIG